MNDFNNLRKMQYENGTLMKNHGFQYSGECHYNFKIKIVAIENLYKVFEQTDFEDPQESATFNGLMVPSYITKSSNIDIGLKRKKIGKNPHEPKIIKSISKSEREINSNKLLTKEIILSNHSQHGISGSAKFSKISYKYGLNFNPYLIYIDVGIYNGCKLLTETSINITKKVPFGNNPRWFN